MIYWDLKIGSHYRKTSEKELLGDQEKEEREKIEKYMKNHCKKFSLLKIDRRLSVGPQGLCPALDRGPDQLAAAAKDGPA
jgi:hypothetical protein